MPLPLQGPLGQSPQQANKKEIPVPQKVHKIDPITDHSIFKGQKEISRSDLRQKLRSSDSYLSEKSVGLNLSPIERSKLEKEVFSSNLGYNISKQDLKIGISKLNRKLASEKNPQNHEKIRKEIKFFKKIGGI